MQRRAHTQAWALHCCRTRQQQRHVQQQQQRPAGQPDCLRGWLCRSSRGVKLTLARPALARPLLSRCSEKQHMLTRAAQPAAALVLVLAFSSLCRCAAAVTAQRPVWQSSSTGSTASIKHNHVVLCAAIRFNVVAMLVKHSALHCFLQATWSSMKHAACFGISISAHSWTYA